MSNPASVYEVRWQEVFPWLLILRAIRLALSIRVLALATVGLLLMQGGSTVIGKWRGDARIDASPASRSAAAHSQNPAVAAVGPRADGLQSTAEMVGKTPVVHAWAWACRPLLHLRQVDDWRDALAAVLSFFWSVAVWAFAGGTIARIAALSLTRDQPYGLDLALRDAARAWPAAAGAPAFTFAAVVIVGVPMVAAGALMRYELPSVLIGLAWGAVLIAGLGFVLAAVGLLVGWPLMIATAAVERSDAFDGISRGFSYVYQRPLHLLWYLVFASVIGLLAETVISFAAEATIGATEHLVAVGLGEAQAATLGTADLPRANLAARAIHRWNEGLRFAVKAFPFALLWPTSVSVYLLLRQQIDGTELDECSVDTEDPTEGWQPADADSQPNA